MVSALALTTLTIFTANGGKASFGQAMTAPGLPNVFFCMP